MFFSRPAWSQFSSSFAQPSLKFPPNFSTSALHISVRPAIAGINGFPGALALSMQQLVPAPNRKATDLSCRAK
jgi:hypothetical protein